MEAGIVPEDLAAAFDDRDAWDAWEALPWSARRATPEWVMMAKRATTRERRIEQAAEVVAEGGRPR